MVDKDEKYAFPWGFHLGDLHKDNESIPLYTLSKDGGFCLLYDDASETKADKLLESLCLELLSTMPHESLKIDLFDVGKKKFYNLSPLQYIHIFKTAYTSKMMLSLFEELEETIISRHKELLCCNRPTISEHNQKSKLKKMYHLALINLENFPTEDIDLRRIQNFIESASQAGVYVILFGNQESVKSAHKNREAMLESFKTLNVTEGEFAITEEIFEFVELLEDHRFASLDLDKSNLMEQVLSNADLESLLNPENIKLEENTKVH